jgi:methylenetetrahydrofolate--tRNA-(uracil-5-)-methyltransferase
MIGALCAYISAGPSDNFQPMNANLGLLPPIHPVIRRKEERHARLLQRALETMDRFVAELERARAVAA